MSYIRTLCFAAFLLSSAIASATPAFHNKNFSQDLIINTPLSVIFVSPSTNIDHVTAFTNSGILSWDLPFYNRIISWKLNAGYLYVISRTRYEPLSTLMTCINPSTGNIVWEKVAHYNE